MVFCLLTSPVRCCLSWVLFYLKTWLMYVVIRLHRHSRIKAQGISLADAPQPIPHPSSNDSYYFEGNADNGVQVVARLGFRGDGTVETWLILRVPGIPQPLKYERYNLVPLDHSVPGGKELSSSGPLRFICNEAMRSWTLVYDGYAWQEEGGVLPATDGDFVDKRYHVRFELVWTALSAVFDYDVELDAWPLARSMATQSWSRAYFREMRSTHQTHYEQHGRLEGAVRVQPPGGARALDFPRLSLRGLRDHSFGLRDWAYVSRWVALFGSLRDGRFFHVAFVEHPLSPAIVAGYMFTPGRGCVAVRGTDISIGDLGGDGLPPAQFAFHFTLSNGRTLRLCCMVRDRIAFHVPPSKGVIFEQTANFTVDGVEGEGIAEFNYALRAYPRAATAPVGKDARGMTKHPSCR